MRPKMQIIEIKEGDWISDSKNGGHSDGKVARLNREPRTREDFAILERQGVTGWECASYGAGDYDGYYRVLQGAMNEYQYNHNAYMRIAKANGIDTGFAENFWNDAMARVQKGNVALSAAALDELLGGSAKKDAAYQRAQNGLGCYAILAVIGVVIGAAYPIVHVLPQLHKYGLGLIDCIEVLGVYLCR